MKWTELEQIIKDTVSKIRFACLDNNSDDVSTALENVKALCDYMFADGKIDIDKDICRIYGYAKELHTNTISYINSNDDIKRVLYEDNKAEHDKEPASLKELAEELIRIECEAMKIADTISQYFKRRGKPIEPQQNVIAAPLQPSDGSGGELTDSGSETRPEGNEQPAIIKEELPTIYDDDVNKAREQYVLYKAIKAGWMRLNGTTYQWQKNVSYLALMCGLLYWEDKVIDDNGAETDDWGEYPKILSKSTHRFKYKSGEITKTSKDINTLFGGVNVSNARSQLDELPDEYGSITRLFLTD